MKIIADKNIPYLKGFAEEYGDVTYLSGADFTKESIGDADTLIVRTVTRLDEAILSGSNIKLICSATIGFDHIDTEYCDKHNIKWVNAPGCNSGSVQQYIVSCLITLSKKRNIDLKGKTIGIVGVGNVGKKVAVACKLLGMNVLLNDPPRKEKENDNNTFVDIDVIQKEADFISFHTPLIKEGKHSTYHLANDHFFSNLAKQPFIINSARGSIIDTRAIKVALDQNLIAGAIIDCWEKEPTIDLEYMQMVDIATPHIAGYSADGKANASRMSLAAVADFWKLPSQHLSSIVAPTIDNALIDYGTLDKQNQLYEILLRTYDPNSDMGRLIENPDKFNFLRSNYPLRREYGAYSIERITSESTDIASILKELGFKFY